jgi:hypothetical protein
MRVYLLWHSYESEYDDCDHDLLLGVYSTREKAEARQADAIRQPGFRLHPDGFEIAAYEVDVTEAWLEGFSTHLRSTGDFVPDPDPD